MARFYNAFLDLLFQDEYPSPAQYHAVIESVMTQPSLTEIDEETQQRLFLDLNDAAPRLKDFLSSFDNDKINTEIANVVILNILEPIMSYVSAELTPPKTVIPIFISGLPSVLRCSKKTQEPLLKALSEADGLLEQLITDHRYSQRVKDWIGKHTYTPKVLSILWTFTQRLMSLHDTCTQDRHTKALSEQWLALSMLTENLEQRKLTYENNQSRNHLNAQDTRHLAGSRLLEEHDKKTSKGQSSLSTFAPQLSDDDLRSLDLFGIATPNSLRSTELALDILKSNETFKVLISVMNTFPCGSCNDSICNPDTAQQPSPVEIYRTQQTDQPFDPEIFARRIGVWKVLLSAQAVRDMRSLAHSGISGILEKKLSNLADGRWKKQGLEVGSKQQRDHLKVPVNRIKCTRNAWILWQIDVGIYDDLAGVKQAVKVWRIVKANELSDAIDKISSLQRLFSPVLIQQCKTEPNSDLDGDFVPLHFPPAEDSNQPIPSGEGRIMAEMDDDLAELSTKSYPLTKKFLQSLLIGDETLEYPFVLSKEELSIVSHSENSALILGRSGTGKTTCLVFKILLNFMTNMSLPGDNAIHQLVLTRSPHLASKLRRYTCSLIESQISTTGLAGKNFLLDAEDEVQEGDTIFSIRSAQLPLVCTFDWFLGLLENTVRKADRNYFSSSEGSSHSSSHSQRREVDFYTFRTEYWNRFPSNLTKNISIELIFAEIMGVIKGSISSADTLAALSHDQYLFDTSIKIAPTFTTNAEREKVYMIYEQYERVKRDAGAVDQIDRVMALLRAIKNNPGLIKQLGQAFDQVCIDEVQDQRCLDIALLLHVVKDARGFHLAGDTAQCISMDSTFRFAEIKGLIFQRYATIGQAAKQEALAKPTVFALTNNYRSHQGILDLASFVMKLIWTGFPDTVDKLSPEYSLRDGPKPMMFVPFQANILTSRMVGFGDLNDNFGAFGAEQVVLVRDDEAKRDLKSEMGDSALILTILESKGMEFDDVVLYNFFCGSSHSASYRRLHLLLGEKGKFDTIKDAVLCSELKHLYVAVTRARNQLWLVESLEQMTDPIVNVFNRGAQQPLVEVVKPTDKDVAAKLKIIRKGGLADPSRWTRRGNEFLELKNYESAKTCFHNARDDWGLKTVRAFLKEEMARTKYRNNDAESVNESEEAIQLFLEVGRTSDVSRCMESLGQYNRAALLWYDTKNYGKAAEFFQLAHSYDKSSECYDLSKNFTKAAEMLRTGNLYDQLIRYLNKNRNFIEPNSCRKYSRLCNLLLKQGRVSPDLRALSIELLGSSEEKEQFFKEFDMTSHLAEFYRNQGRSAELFQLLVEDGQLRQALDLAAANDFQDGAHEREIETAFHLLHVERLFCRSENEPDSFLVPRNWETNLPPYLSSASKGWNALPHIVNSVKKGEMFGALANVQNAIVKECFCLWIVALLPDYITQTRSSSELPIEVMQVVATLVYNLSSEKYGLYSKSLHLVCGILKTPSEKELYLPWSPLSLSRTSLSTQQLATQWMINRLSLAVIAFDERARDLWTQEWPSLCLNFLSQKPCAGFNTQSDECIFLHKNRTEEDCSLMLTGILNVASVFTAMSRLYLTRVMTEHFQGRFLARRRFWLQQLIRWFTYVSATDQSPSAVTRAISTLHSNKTYLTVIIGLEDFLFYRIGKEWQDRSSLPSLLAQYELSLLLGNEVNKRFLGGIRRKIDYCLNPRGSLSFNGDQLHQLRIARQAINSFHRIQAAISESDEELLYNNLVEFLGSFDLMNSNALSEFHAVVMSFEYIATFLLCARRPVQSIVLPCSWAILHLVPTMQSGLPKLVVSTEEERSKYTRLLSELVFSFTFLLERLDQSITRGGFVFRCSGSRLSSSSMQRRNMELLAVIALNMGSDTICDPDFGKMWDRIKQAFRFGSSPVRNLDQSRFDLFVHNLLRSYSLYGGKDSLYVIQFDENQSNAGHVRQNLLREVSTCTLRELSLANNSVNNRKILPSNDTAASPSSESTDHEAQVRKIQHFWRKYLPRMLNARSFNRTPQGRLFVSFLDLVATCVPKDIPLRSRLAIRAKFLTVGIELHITLDTITRKLQLLRKVFSDLLADSSLPPSRLESLQDPWSRILLHESRVAHFRTSWSTDHLRTQHWWLDPIELQKALTKNLEELRSIKEQVDALEVE